MEKRDSSKEEAEKEFKKKAEKSSEEFSRAWNEFFHGKNKKETPKTDEEEKKQLEEFTEWYNNVRKQSDTGKTPAEMYREAYGENPPTKPQKPSRIQSFYWDEDYDEELIGLVCELSDYDNEEGYKLSYEEIENKLNPTVDKLVKKGEKALFWLHDLLKNEETWSCLFALKTIRRIKSPKSIQPLINFLIENENGEFYEGYEEATFTFQGIGEPAVEPLIKQIKEDIKNKDAHNFLMEALTAIKDDRVYEFMKKITEDYINDYKKYDDWFPIHMWVINFDKQEKKEILPVLERLYNMQHLSEDEKIEIKDTIKILKDPEEYEKEFQKEREKMKEILSEFENTGDYSKEEQENSEGINHKNDEETEKEFSDKDGEEFLRRMETPDRDFEANFRCRDCKEKQNLKTGLIVYSGGKRFLYEKELRCKKCFSNNIELTKEGKKGMLRKLIRVSLGNEGGVINMSDEITVEDKKMPFNQATDYLLKRLKQNPNSGELHLRYANLCSKRNIYNEAIENYKKSVELNPKLIASYLNLVEIYIHRYEYYEVDEAGNTAIDYFYKLLDLFNSGDYNPVTLASYDYLIEFINENSKKLGLNVKIKK